MFSKAFEVIRSTVMFGIIVMLGWGFWWILVDMVSHLQ